MGRIFGIPDPSPKVSWRFVLVVALISGGLLYARSRGGDVAVWAPRLVALGVPAFLILYLTWTVAATVWRVRRHPASRITALLREGRMDEACTAADDLLREHPRDPVVGITASMAYQNAGRRDEARALLMAVDESKVPGYYKQLYGELKAGLHE